MSVVLQVALEGIENILKLGEDHKEALGVDTNEYAGFVEEADGMDKLETLQVRPPERESAQPKRWRAGRLDRVAASLWCCRSAPPPVACISHLRST